jgi:dihydrofolate synthase/folylpolyglutamate synthase
MAASILTAGGYRTGLYTSPHLMDFRERIRIDGAMISDDEVAVCVEKVKAEVREAVSYFEFLTCVAFIHFLQREVDMAVLEVGMGGRLDATNVVHPMVSVITNISLEHREYLGNTLEMIAREKGGIIREGGVCLTAALQKPVLGLLEALCREKGAILYRWGKDIRTRIHRDGTFAYRGIEGHFQRLSCPLIGRHQYANAALALGAVEVMGRAGIALSERAVQQGLRNTRWEGRLEILQREPLLLLDGAHNPAGAETLRRALLTDFSYRRLWLIFGVLEDKEYRTMARKLFPLADGVIITRPQSDRALAPDRLLPIAGRFNKRILVVEDPGEALRKALSQAGKEDLVCVAGSLFLVGAIKRMYLQSGDGRNADG